MPCPLRSIRFRIDAFPQIPLAAALTAAAGARAGPARLGHRFARADAGAAAPALTPKRSFDDTPPPAATPAATPAVTPTPESATPAGTGARCRAPRRRPPRPRPSPRLPPELAPAAAYRRAGSRSCADRRSRRHRAPAATADPVVIMPTAEDTGPASCAQGATANGLTLADWDKYTAGAKLLPTTVSPAKGQPEGRESWWDYIAKTVDDERVADGKMMMKKVGSQLNTIGQQYQVDPATLVAIFGIETNYGRQIGKTNVLNAWLTRACTENKPLWEKNAYASVRLLRDGVVPADNFVGSWSGAFGMTQFIPTSFYELAADGDGDGRIDLYNSLPDALASTANHPRKRRAKWTMGLPAVVEVRLPAELAATIPPEPDAEYVGAKDRRTIAQWVQAGVKQGNGAAPAVLGRRRAGLSVRADRFARSGVPGDRQFRRHPALQPVAPLRAGRGAAAQPPAGPPGRPRRGRPMTLACRARRSRNCRTCCTISAMTSACPTASPAPRPARPCAPSRSAATCRRTAAGKRIYDAVKASWPPLAAPARPPSQPGQQMTRVSGTQGYGEHAMALAERYESISFADVHAEVAHLIPPAPARIADIGAGSGRDAAALARMGHQVIAVEPPPSCAPKASAAMTCRDWRGAMMPCPAWTACGRVASVMT